MKIAIVRHSTVRKYKRLDAGFYLGAVDRKKGEATVEQAQRYLRAAISRLRNARAAKKAADERITRMIRAKEVVPVVDINDEINRLSRQQLVQLLTVEAGIQCYDEESVEDLREAVRVNVADGTIPEEAVWAVPS